MRGFASENPQQWAQYFPLSEWWYNTAYHRDEQNEPICSGIWSKTLILGLLFTRHFPNLGNGQHTSHQRSKYLHLRTITNLWDMFFMAIQPLVDKFIEESGSSETPISLFFYENEKPFKACFISQEREIAFPQHSINPIH